MSRVTRSKKLHAVSHMNSKPVLTRALTPMSGCALDPCVEEASWIAWRLESASPNMITSDSSIEDANGLFDRILEMAWLPGRMVAISEVGVEFNEGFPQVGGPPLSGSDGPVGNDGRGGLFARRPR